jgi:hypothetical protein
MSCLGAQCNAASIPQAQSSRLTFRFAPRSQLIELFRELGRVWDAHGNACLQA